MFFLVWSRANEWVCHTQYRTPNQGHTMPANWYWSSSCWLLLLWVEWNNTFVFNCMHTFSQPTHHCWWIHLFAERLRWFRNYITESYVCLMCCIVLQCVYCAYRCTVVHFSQGRLQKHREKNICYHGSITAAVFILTSFLFIVFSSSIRSN